jgi:hypothetical protein
MVFWLLMHMLTLIVDFFTLLGIMNGDKDLEIVLLRQQVRILQRTVKSPPRITTPERMILAALTDKYKQSREDLQARHSPWLASRIGASQMDFQTKRKSRQAQNDG